MRGTMSLNRISLKFTQIHSNLPPPPPNPPTRHALCLFHLNSKTKRICEKKTYFTHLMNFEILHLLPIANPGRASCWDHVWPILLHFLWWRVIRPSTSGCSGWPFGDNWNSSAGDPRSRRQMTLGQLTRCHFSDIGAEPKRDTPKLSTGHLKLIVHWTSWESINHKLPKLCPLETNYQKVTHGAPSSPTLNRPFLLGKPYTSNGEMYDTLHSSKSICISGTVELRYSLPILPLWLNNLSVV